MYLLRKLKIFNIDRDIIMLFYKSALKVLWKGALHISESANW